MLNVLKNKKYFLGGMIIVLIAGGYYWYNSSVSPKEEKEYKTVKAEKGDITASVSGSGNVIVDDNANIDPTITGTVINLAVSVGDQVKKGQFLFEIENDELGVNVTKTFASYLQAQQSLETAKANKKEAHNNLDDANDTSELIYRRKYDASKLGLVAAEENVKVALENYRIAQKDYTDRKVVAPISGTINEINIKNGDDLSKLSSGSSREVPIIIGDLNTIKAKVEVSEVDIASVQIGQTATLTFNALDDFSIAGKVEKISALGILESGVVTYEVIIAFDSFDSRIRPEMNVSASIVTDSKKDVITVPNSALKTNIKGYYVEILNNNEIEKRTVEIGLENNSKTEIKSGLQTGEIVITQTINGITSDKNASSNLRNGNMRIPGMGR
jgi:RND family efflux transporter MFP subunit